MPASTSATWRTFTLLPSRARRPASAEQAAHVAGQQRVGAGFGDRLGLVGDHADGDVGI
jgi:hypothetical protein